MTKQDWEKAGIVPPPDIDEKVAMHQASQPWWVSRTGLPQQTPEQHKMRLDHFYEQFVDTAIKMEREEQL